MSAEPGSDGERVVTFGLSGCLIPCLDPVIITHWGHQVHLKEAKPSSLSALKYAA